MHTAPLQNPIRVRVSKQRFDIRGEKRIPNPTMEQGIMCYLVAICKV